jgi:hypothetical protein
VLAEEDEQGDVVPADNEEESDNDNVLDGLLEELIDDTGEADEGDGAEYVEVDYEEDGNARAVCSRASTSPLNACTVCCFADAALAALKAKYAPSVLQEEREQKRAAEADGDEGDAPASGSKKKRHKKEGGKEDFMAHAKRMMQEDEEREAANRLDDSSECVLLVFAHCPRAPLSTRSLFSPLSLLSALALLRTLSSPTNTSPRPQGRGRGRRGHRAAPHPVRDAPQLL